jgi:type 1 fimbria pilin
MIKRVLILSFAAAVAGVLLACGTASQHTEAITAAIVGYSDYYIEVHNLSEQVKQGYQSIDPKQSAVAYTIEVSIPDYTADEFRSIAYTIFPQKAPQPIKKKPCSQFASLWKPTR